jgi:hypothetical protein
MRIDVHPSSIRYTSDCVAFDGFRVIVRELPDEGEAGSGKRGLPCFRFACRPGQEKGRTVLTFRENPESALVASRIALIIPPNRAYSLSWRRAAGRVGAFEARGARKLTRAFRVFGKFLARIADESFLSERAQVHLTGGGKSMSAIQRDTHCFAAKLLED